MRERKGIMDWRIFPDSFELRNYREMAMSLAESLTVCRPAMARAQLSEDEFLACLGLALWNVNEQLYPEHLQKLAERQVKLFS